MNCNHLRSGRAGFSLVELLLVVAILAVLSGVLYAASGGVREKSRQAVCRSQLRQIGMAIAMYRQDYGGSDAPGWPSEMGLPTSDWVLNKTARPGGGRYLTASDAILFCPNFSRAEHPESAGSYGWIPWGPNEHSIPGLPPFPEEVARRGGDMPIVYCLQHDFPPPDRPQNAWYVIVLRLDGRVTSRHAPIVNSWQW
jgi:prepilin-type N-terminal cleavage/methylation domain-containing protein